MKALRILDGGLLCLMEDAIFLEDDSYMKINGDSMSGFSVESPQKIERIEEKGWSNLSPTLEFENDEYIAIAGETSWGGEGFVAIRSKKTNSLKWLILLSVMNNPIHIKIENSFVRLTTDLNFPNGLDFIIPIKRPEGFNIEEPKAENV